MRCITAGAQTPLRDEIKVQGAAKKMGLSRNQLTHSGKPEEIGFLAVWMLGCTILQPNRNRAELEHKGQGC
jgi:hypothetical protein